MFSPNNPKMVISKICHSITYKDYDQDSLSRVADINLQNLHGRTLLTTAVSFLNEDLVIYLIDKCNANINARNHDFTTALHSAISSEDIDIIILLLEKGADLWAFAPQPEISDSPIIYAFECGNNSIIQILLKYIIQHNPENITELYELAERFNKINLLERQCHKKGVKLY